MNPEIVGLPPRHPPVIPEDGGLKGSRQGSSIRYDWKTFGGPQNPIVISAKKAVILSNSLLIDLIGIVLEPAESSKSQGVRQ